VSVPETIAEDPAEGVPTYGMAAAAAAGGGAPGVGRGAGSTAPAVHHLEASGRGPEEGTGPPLGAPAASE